MDEEIKISPDGNKITIFSEGKDGSLYERTIYLKDKEQTQSQDDNKEQGE